MSSATTCLPELTFTRRCSVLAQLIEGADAKVRWLLDAYTDCAPGLDLPKYKRRREAVQQEVDQARARLAELDEPEPLPPSTKVVAGSPNCGRA